jgi:hypothetical protein
MPVKRGGVHTISPARGEGADPRTNAVLTSGAITDSFALSSEVTNPFVLAREITDSFALARE